MSKVLFRADGSSNIGVGHIVRCATLAHELHARGAQVHLVISSCFSLPDWVVALFPGAVHEHESIAGSVPDHGVCLSHADWLNGSQADDVLQTQKIINQYLDGIVDWIVVDHYALDARWHRSMHDCCSSMMAIDDLADRDLDVSIVLDPNRSPVTGEKLYRLLTHEDCFLAMGPQWALIRDEFQSCQSERQTEIDNPRILLMSGGSNIGSLASVCLEGVLALERVLDIDVIVGSSAVGAELKNLCEGSHHQVQIHVSPNQPAHIMASADLAISSAGSTTWELACLGVPALLLTVAENQKAVVQQAVDAGTAVHIESLNRLEITHLTEQFIQDKDRLLRMSEAGRQLVDGKGASRIAERILNS